MTVLAWILIIFLTLGLALLIFFLFGILLPSIYGESKIKDDPVFSQLEMSYVIPKEDVVNLSEKRAFVLCSPDKSFKCQKTIFNDGLSCLTANAVFSSSNDCKFSCLGLGDCVKACPQEAIYIKNQTAIVSSLCIGCGLCLNACPKGIIKLIPKTSKNEVICANTEKVLTSCSDLGKETTVVREEKKDFKLWQQCYKILKIKK